METKFNFKSRICTDSSQSERLLTLGLKKETADCFLMLVGDLGGSDLYTIRFGAPYDGWTEGVIPAWSLHRLIEMMPNDIGMGEECYITQVVLCKRIFAYMDFGSIEYMFGEKDNSYDNAINCIEWLIKEGYFNKEYLEE